MKRDLLACRYIQADETPIGMQTPDKRGQTHKGYFWQFSALGKGVIFNFEMTRSKKVAQKFFKHYDGMLHTVGYVAYEKYIGIKEMIHAFCWSHSRRGFIEALKVQQKANATNRELERVVVLIG